MTAVATRIKDSLQACTSLLEALDAVRHRRAAALLAATLSFVAVFLTVPGAVANWPGAGSAAVGGLLTLLSFLVGAAALLVGGNAAGIMLADEVWQRPARSVGAALRVAMALAPRALAATLLAAAALLAYLVALATLLFACRMPVLGPLLYAVALPLATLAGGLLLFVMFGLALPLAAPGLWNGDDLARVGATLQEVWRRRLLDVVVMTVGLGLLAGLIAATLAAIVVAGSALPLSLALAVLDDRAGYGIAATFGLAVLCALAAVPPLLVAMKGAAIAHRQLSAGLAIDEAAADLQRRVERLGRTTGQRQLPAVPHAGAARVCPNADCGEAVAEGDAFCMTCGERLK